MVFQVPIALPYDIGRKTIDKGLYLQSSDQQLFHLFQKGEEWYLQFVGDQEPTLITKDSSNIQATKVDPGDLLKKIQQEREFIESKLVSLTEKTS